MGVKKLTKLKKTTEDDPENLDAWFELGKYATDRFIVSVGEEALSKVAQERPDDATVLGLLAKALNRKRKLIEAEKIYLRALDLEPDDPELITGLAVVYGNQGELEKSLPFYERVFVLNKGYPWAVHAFISMLGRLGRDNEAIPLLEEALKVNPDSALINILYGLEQQKNREESLSKKHLELGMKLIDKVDCEEQSRALRMLIENYPDSVIKLGNRILEEDPENMDIELFVNLARSNTEPQVAAVEMKKMLERDPTSPRIIGMLMKVLFQLGDMAGVMELKERLETVAPEDPLTSVANMILTRTQPGGLLVSQQTREEYVESTHEILKRFPISSHANLLYIQALISNNQIDDAKAQAIKVNNEIKMEDTRQYLTLANILRSLGLSKESKAQYQAASDVADSPYESFLIHLVELTEDENYIELEKTCSRFIEENKATPDLYAILGRVQHYTNHDDSKPNLEIAAEGG
ncbi:MAG: tetratricopeptide repeat protein, partial [Candidatus Thorarchaeota archaeon]|nr:tetratricopeptide repeat protein [Candidatus Thorarchaeota archaeon]